MEPTLQHGDVVLVRGCEPGILLNVLGIVLPTSPRSSSSGEDGEGRAAVAAIVARERISCSGASTRWTGPASRGMK